MTGFVDAEAMVIDFLRARVDAPLGTTIPNPRPDPFVRVWRNGGPSRNRVLDAPLITIEAWAADSTVASALADACRFALSDGYAGMPLVRSVTEISGSYSIPDDDTKTPRYRFSVQMLVRRPRS